MVPLPPYARRVEYLESTGTQWIDTGMFATSEDKIIIEFRSNNQDSAVSVFGGRNSVNENNVIVGTGSVGNMTAYFSDGSGMTDYGANPGQLSPIARMIATLSKTERSIYNVDDGNYNSINTLVMPAVFTGNLTLYVFRANGNPYGTNWFIGRVYKIIWTRSSTPVRSFIPCRILDTGYLWDEVEGKFYGNQGTGDFVLGPDVREGVVPTRLNPFGVGRRQEKIRRVEYLESTGEQFVDTGVVPSSSFGFEMVFAETVRQTNTNAGIFGREITDGNTTRCALFTDWTHHPVFYGDDKVTFDSVLPVNQATSFGASASTGECHVGNNSLNGFTLNGLYTDTVRIFPNQAKPAIGRVYSCQIFVGSTLVRDFFPVAIGSVGYLLDRVSGRLFGNHGTGVFVVGPDTVSSENVSTISMKGINI